MPSRRTGILVLLALLGPLLALVAPSPALAEEIVELAEAADAAPDGTIRVVVELDVATVPEAYLSDGAVTRQRDRIDDAAADLLEVLPEVSGFGALETHPTIAIDATSEVLEALASSDAVSSITPDRLLEPTLDSSVPVVQGDLATAAGYDGAGWNVAVLDTGVESTHSFLGGRVVEQVCFSSGNDCPNETSFDDGPNAGEPCTYHVGCDHGTHVAGIVAGSQLDANPGPTQGVAPAAGIVAVQVFSEDTTPPINGPTASGFDIERGLDWVLENHEALDIAAVNMSLGGAQIFAGDCDGFDSSMSALITSLRAAGVATVVSSGNDEQSAGMSWPACISTAIAVGATVDEGAIAGYSNVSPTIDLLAPGSSIDSSTLGSGFGGKNGTSMAAPHVAGAWAALREARTTGGFPPDVVSELHAFRTSGIPIDDLVTQDIPRVRLYDALLPATPTDIGVVAGIGDATVSWTDPTWTGAGVITGYEVDVWETLEPDVVTTIPVAAGSASTVVPSLEVPGDHSFSVRAVNVVGAGMTSDSATVSTAPGAPTNVVAEAGNARATVSWTAPGDGGSPITDYLVTASPAPSVADATSAVGSDATELAFTGLTNGSAYTFTVTAVNAVGESVASASSNEVTPRAPSSGGGGGGGGGGAVAPAPTTTTTAPPPTTTSTTRPPATTTTTTVPRPEPEPDPVASPGASVGNGDVVTIRDGEAVVIPRSAPVGANVVGGAVTPSGDGAWSVTSTGEVFVAGDARDLGDLAGFRLNAPVVGIAPTRTGNGYWLLGRDGGIFSFGDAPFFGSTGGMVLNQPVVGMAASESGDGYWLFAGDGGIFTFGDARFFGSTGALRLNAPVTTMAPTPSGRGYWLLGADGGVFTFGDASFHGSTGGRNDVGAIEAIVPSDTGRGYWLIGDDGRLHTFGDAT